MGFEISPHPAQEGATGLVRPIWRVGPLGHRPAGGGLWMLAIYRITLIGNQNGVVGKNFNPQRLILIQRKLFSKPVQRADHICPQRYRTYAGNIALVVKQDPLDQIRRSLHRTRRQTEMFGVPPSGILVQPLGQAIDGHQAWVSGENGGMTRQTVLKKVIVTVEKRHKFARGIAQSQVSRRGRATVFLPGVVENPDPAICRCSLCSDPRAQISASVIDEQELPIREGLGQDAGNRRAEVSLLVPKGRDDSKARHPSARRQQGLDRSARQAPIGTL